MAASVISTIIKTNTDPKYLSQDHYTLIAFIILLNARTLYSPDAITEMTDKMLKQVFSHDPKIEEHINEIKITLDNPAAVSVWGASLNLPIVFDLQYKLIVNETNTPFVTSDNPVVLYNQFLEKRKPWGSITGLAVKGLQIIAPLSPKHIIFFYDPDVYRIGGNKHRPIKITTEDDINSLNSLQILTANENLYFNNNITENYLLRLIGNSNNIRRKVKTNIKEYQGGTDKEGNQESLIHSFKEDIRCNLTLSFAHESPRSQGFKMGNKSIHYRNDFMVKTHQEFLKLVDAKQYKPSEFFDYLSNVFKDHSTANNVA